METETPTPTFTPEPTLTLTPSATPTATPNFYIEMTMEVEGDYARVSRDVSIADYWIILLLIAILLSMWVMYIATRLKGEK
jgi:hypothetical protein